MKLEKASQESRQIKKQSKCDESAQIMQAKKKKKNGNGFNI